MEEFISSKGNEMPRYAIIPRTFFQKSQRFFQQLVKRKMIKQVTLDEMVESLTHRKQTLQEFAGIVKWYSSSDVQNELFTKAMKEKNTLKLLNALVVVVNASEDSSNAKDSGSPRSMGSQVEQHLGKIKYFALNKTMQTLPMPPGTVHPSIRNLCKKELMSKSFAWSELSFSEWWKYVKRSPPLLRGEYGQAEKVPRGEWQKGRIVSQEINNSLLGVHKEQYLGMISFIAENYAKATEQLKQDIASTLKRTECILVDTKEQEQPTACT